MVGTVLLMRHGNNGRIRLLPMWWLISLGAFTMTPWWRPPAWQLSAVHGGGYSATSTASTDAVTNQASAHIQMPRASLDKCRFDPIWTGRITKWFFYIYFMTAKLDKYAKTASVLKQWICLASTLCKKRGTVFVQWFSIYKLLGNIFH